MIWSHQLVICCALLFHEPNMAYYLSPNHRNWVEANAYCVEHCNSHLAVIQNNDDFEAAIYQSLPEMDPLFGKLLEASPICVYSNFQWTCTPINGTDNVWIGLNMTNNKWIDNSDVTFTQWSVGYPTNTAIGNNCVQLSMDNDNKWINTDCKIKSRFLCESCDSQLNKYIGIDLNKEWPDAHTYCQDVVGTDLASLHSERDLQESLSIIYSMALDNDEGLYDYASYGLRGWIGLHDRTMSDGIDYNFVYTDGTTFDYASDTSGGVYPWLNVSDTPWSGPKREPDNNGFAFWEKEDSVQVVLGASNSDDYDEQEWTGLWDVDGTARSDPFICNMPSELCTMNTDLWNIAYNTFDDMNIDGCEMSTNSTNSYFEAVLYGKQWVNNGGNLIIEYMFGFSNWPSSHWISGILLYSFMDNATRYEIGVVADGTSSPVLFVKTNINTNGSFDEQLSLNDTPIELNLDTYYLLRIVVANGNTFNISINNVLLLSVTDDVTETTRIPSRRSGYIGMYNMNAALTAKSLYVSGEIYNPNEPTTTSTEIPTTTSTTTTSTTFASSEPDSFKYNYTVTVTIIFTYTSLNDITRDKVDQTLQNITTEIIDKSVLTSDSINANCIETEDYNINVKDEIISDTQTNTIINASIFVCDRETVRNLIFVIDGNLQKELDEEIEAKLPDITILDEAEITVTSINVELTITSTTIPLQNDAIPKNENQSDAFWLIIMIGAGGIACCILGLCVIFIYKLKQSKKENAETMGNTATTMELSTYPRKSKSTPGGSNLYRIDSQSHASRSSFKASPRNSSNAINALNIHSPPSYISDDNGTLQISPKSSNNPNHNHLSIGHPRMNSSTYTTESNIIDNDSSLRNDEEMEENAEWKRHQRIKSMASDYDVMNDVNITAGGPENVIDLMELDGDHDIVTKGSFDVLQPVGNGNENDPEEYVDKQMNDGQQQGKQLQTPGGDIAVIAMGNVQIDMNLRNDEFVVDGESDHDIEIEAQPSFNQSPAITPRPDDNDSDVDFDGIQSNGDPSSFHE